MTDFPKASFTRPATANQLATVAELCRLLKLEITVQEDWTSADASEEITRLARIYDARQAQPRRR